MRHEVENGLAIASHHDGFAVLYALGEVGKHRAGLLQQDRRHGVNSSMPLTSVQSGTLRSPQTQNGRGIHPRPLAILEGRPAYFAETASAGRLV
jgi:hypothetical protein